MANDIYYNPQQLLSHNCLFNFVVGNRGAGKTYSFKRLVIKRFLKTGAQFIYLRRYKTEFKRFENFFNDIAHEFPEHEFKVKGSVCYIDGKVAGWGVALSTALTLKSVNFEKVEFIGFDEFVIDSKLIHYLSNEVTAFLEFYETVARLRDNVRVLFLSNAVSVVNPYFTYWNIKVSSQRRFTKIGHIIVEFVRNEEFVQAKYNTRFGQIIKGTNYGDYAVENKFLKDNLNFVEKKSKHAKFEFSVIYKNHRYGFWSDFRNGVIYCSKNYDPSSKIIYAITDEEHNYNVMLIKSANRSPFLRMAIEAYEGGYMRFEDLEIKNQCIEIFGVLKR